MTRRDFLKMMRDTSMTIPVMAINGHSLQQAPIAQPLELKPPTVVLTGGSIEWSTATYGYMTPCGT